MVVPMYPIINNKSALLHLMAWHWMEEMPSSEKKIQFTDEYIRHQASMS